MKVKRIIGAAVSAAVVFSAVCSLTASAEDVVDPKGKAVTGTYTSDGDTAVYKVDIEWGALAYTFTGTEKGVWDPDECEYVYSEEPGKWEVFNNSNKITLTNHSNVPISGMLCFFPTKSGITAGFTSDERGENSVTSIELESAEPEQGETVGEAKSGSAYLQITGGTLEKYDINTVLGIVTVTIK